MKFENDDERLVAEQAWLNYRELKRVMKDAPHGERMLSLAGMSWSFDTASDRLAELCLLKVSNDKIRKVSEEEGHAVQRWIQKSSKPGEVFKQACGEHRRRHQCLVSPDVHRVQGDQ